MIFSLSPSQTSAQPAAADDTSAQRHFRSRGHVKIARLHCFQNQIAYSMWTYWSVRLFWYKEPADWPRYGLTMSTVSLVLVGRDFITVEWFLSPVCLLICWFRWEQHFSDTVMVYQDKLMVFGLFNDRVWQRIKEIAGIVRITMY